MGKSVGWWQVDSKQEVRLAFTAPAFAAAGDVFENEVTLRRFDARRSFEPLWREGTPLVCVKRLNFVLNLFAWPAEHVLLFWGKSVNPYEAGRGMHRCGAVFVAEGSLLSAPVRVQMAPPWAKDLDLPGVPRAVESTEGTAYDLIEEGE